jgi:large-conductance mechanosensitive channel
MSPSSSSPTEHHSPHPFTQYLIDSPGSFNLTVDNDQQNMDFLIATEGNIRIESTDKHSGNHIYTIIPKRNTITITNFNIETDLIDLSCFYSLRTIEDLSFSEHPLTIILHSYGDYQQKIIFPDLTSFVLTEKNFVFTLQNGDNDHINKKTIDSSLWISFVLFFICAAFVSFLVCLPSSVLKKKEDNEEEEDEEKRRHKETDDEEGDYDNNNIFPRPTPTEPNNYYHRRNSIGEVQPLSEKESENEEEDSSLSCEMSAEEDEEEEMDSLGSSWDISDDSNKVAEMPAASVDNTEFQNVNDLSSSSGSLNDEDSDLDDEEDEIEESMSSLKSNGVERLLNASEHLLRNDDNDHNDDDYNLSSASSEN